MNYFFPSSSDTILQMGVTVLVDAQKTTARINRNHARFIFKLFEGLTVNLYLVKSEGFWEKHVETCTKSQTKGEVGNIPIKSQLTTRNCNQLIVCYCV